MSWYGVCMCIVSWVMSLQIWLDKNVVYKTFVCKEKRSQERQSDTSSIRCDKLEHAFNTFWINVWGTSHRFIVFMDWTRITTRRRHKTETYWWTNLWCLWGDHEGKKRMHLCDGHIPTARLKRTAMLFLANRL